MIDRHRARRRVLKISGAGRASAMFLGLYFLSALVIYWTEPSIGTFWDSIWYCFTVVTTIGFGDNSAVAVIPRLVTMALSFYSIFFVAILTSVITSYYIEVMKHRAEDSASAFLDKLERLPELSKEELAELSETVRKYANRK